MAQPSNDARPFVNLDYFSISPSSSPRETHQQQRTDLPFLHTSDPVTRLVTDGVWSSERPSATPASTNSSPSDSKSQYSNAWEISPNEEAVVSGSHSRNSFAHSPSSPLTPLDVQLLTNLESEPEVTGHSIESFSVPFNIDDWMSWDRNDSTDATWPSQRFPKTEPLSPGLTGIELAPQKRLNTNDSIHVPRMFQYDQSSDSQTPQAQPLSLAGQPGLLSSGRGLYSTPLSWDTPSPGPSYLPISAIMNHDLGSPDANFGFARRSTTLSRSQEAQLRMIAMPQLAQSNMNMPGYVQSYVSSSPSSPEGSSSPYDRRNSSATDQSFVSSSGRTGRRSTLVKRDSDTKQHQQPIKKTAHNMIEKRYRTNLNDKISALRDSVPSLRVAARKEESDGKKNEDEDLQGLAPAHKLNKATVLSKATEYIAHLESKTRELTRDNEGMKRRIDAFEQLFEQQLLLQEQPRKRRERNDEELQRTHQNSSTRR